VFLHVGPPKTGTTYLQDLLWSNRDTLRGAGVLLPGKDKAEHFRAAREVRKPDGARKGPLGKGGTWKRLVSQMRAWPGRSVVSSEWFAGTGPAGVKTIVESLSDTPVHLVITVRELGGLVPAVWQERVKNGDVRTLPEFLAELSGRPDKSDYGRTFWSVHDTRQVVRRWLEHLPPEHVHLVVVPGRGLPPGELWTRFAGLFVDDPEAFDTSAAAANPGLAAADAEFLRQVNVELGDRLDKNLHAALVKKLVAKATLAGRDDAGARVTLDAATRKWLARRADKTIEGLKAQGCHVVGDLEELRVSPEGPPVPSSPEEADPRAVARAGVISAARLLLLLQDTGMTPQQAALATEG
jgi:hypothetical protein